MAKIIKIDKKNPRRKKFEHFKLKFRVYLFRTSYLLNLLCVLYLANESGYLTNIIRMVNPILEAIKTKLPL